MAWNFLAIGTLASSFNRSPQDSVQLWNLKTRRMERQIRPAFAPPGRTCFSPDGKLLATSAVRGTPLQLWRVADGVEVANFPVEADAHGRDPTPLSFSPDGRRFAAADANRDIDVWELATGQKIHPYRGHQQAVTSIAFVPDGDKLLSGSEDATLLLWAVGGQVEPGRAPLTNRQLHDYWEALADADASVALDADKALREALADNRSPAVRRRIEDVLRVIHEFPIPPATLQRTRAIQLLEQIGSAEAQAVLRTLAAAERSTAASVEAHQSLQRLDERARAPRARVAP